MRIPVDWLKEYVTVRMAPKALAERLTMAGLEVVGVVPSDGGPVLDLEITPNRADCLSILGIAREVAAITHQRLKLPSGARGKGRVARETKGPRPPPPAPRPILRIEDRKGCSRYIGRLIEEVRIGPSPDWMQRRLLACEARPINNVVDITNYVLFEYGQPLHAFDFDRLAQGTILVRRARPKEPITTLDGVARMLSADMLVIADAARPVAVAGVMGGMGSEVTQGTTTRVLLESALFDPISVRRTARALGVTSESSYRFERGVDPGGVEAASTRAASLLCELAGGTLRTTVDAGTKPSKRTVIALDGVRVNRWLGTRLSGSTIRTTLARLSCRVASSGTGDAMRVGVPSFRQDLRGDVDLAEELARLQGYDRLPSHVPTSALPEDQGDSAPFWRLQSLRCLCASLGLAETINWSLISETELARCGFLPSEAIRLVNPLSQDHAYLRPSLLMGLLQTVRRNVTQGMAAIHVFEVGAVASAERTAESIRVGLALSGTWVRDWRANEPCDFFRLKGLIETLIGRLCQGEVRFVPTPHRWAEPTVSTAVALNGEAIGMAGQVSRTVAESLDMKQPVWVAELSVSDLLKTTRATTAIRIPATLPPVKRDLSISVDEHIPFEEFSRAISEVGGTLASHVELIDRYTGESIPKGKYSLTFSIEYRDPARTLTAAEVDALHQRIGQTLASRFGATLR